MLCMGVRVYCIVVHVSLRYRMFTLFTTALCGNADAFTTFSEAYLGHWASVSIEKRPDVS